MKNISVATSQWLFEYCRCQESCRFFLIRHFHDFFFKTNLRNFPAFFFSAPYVAAKDLGGLNILGGVHPSSRFWQPSGIPIPTLGAKWSNLIWYIWGELWLKTFSKLQKTLQRHQHHPLSLNMLRNSKKNAEIVPSMSSRKEANHWRASWQLANRLSTERRCAVCISKGLPQGEFVSFVWSVWSAGKN